MSALRWFMLNIDALWIAAVVCLVGFAFVMVMWARSKGG